MLDRRSFLKAAALAPFCFGRIKPSKPDVLLIMPDQMRGDCLSILGHPGVRTPHMDQLAEEGVLFRRAYTTVASCIPARYALLTGLYPQTSGVVGFRAKPFSTQSMPQLLSEGGYSTVLVGRNMHQNKASKSCGYDKRILGSTYVADDDYDKFLKQAAPETGGIRKLVKDLGITFNHWQAEPWPLENRFHPTQWIVEQSKKVILETHKDQPLFLTASFYAPHPPLFPPKEIYEEISKRKLPEPARGNWVDWKALSPKGDRNGHRILLQGETLKKAQTGYFGLIEHLDQQIAGLIKAFRTRSEKAGRPWVIVLTSDHGEMLGDHGYFRKCEPFEGSANIPFIVCGSPELGFKAGLRIKQPVCLEDIMPTVLGLCEFQKPIRVDGVDLSPCLRGKAQKVRDWLHFEHAPCYSKEQAYHALTDGRVKYIWRPLDGKELLFDLDKDPEEERDLSKKEPGLLKSWRKRLIKRLKNRSEGFSKEGKLIPGRPYKALNEGLWPR